MFGPEEDDTDFLSPTGGAKLASLFGLDQTVSRPGNESFQYTAPKQPKKGGLGTPGTKPSKPPGSAGPGQAPSVIFASPVHAYKFINGQYVKQGKFGAAVLGNHMSKEYRILLYVSQQQPVTTARIHPAFAFTIQLNNYAAFYDDQRQSWSLMFESEMQAVDFSKQVCIAKCNSSPVLDTVMCQDLLAGDGQGADVGDLLEVAYTGWLFHNQVLGQMFDSNVQKDKMLRLKLGSGKVIKGWEEGMLGMKKGGKRLLIIPPSLGYGSQEVTGRIPPNSTLVFEVEVKRMKLKDSGSDKQSTSSRDSPVLITDRLPPESSLQPPTSVPPQPGEPAVRAKSNSISEQLTNPDMAKAKLISRMARMGQPMLPFLAGSTTPQPDSSDSEIEDPNIQRISPHPAAPLPIRPTPQISHAPVGSHLPAAAPQPMSGLQAPPSAALLPVASIPSQAFPQATGVPPNSPVFQPYTGLQYPYSHSPVTQLQPMASVYPPQIQQPPHFQASGDVTSFLMTEARQHNTEIRMSISKVSDKIDNLTSQLDKLQKENSSSASHLLPGISSITMESAMIMNNIQRIIQENERLKQEVLEKSSRIEEQNVKIGELITRNQRYVEQSNLLMEQRNDSLQTTTESTQARVLHAVQEKHALHTDLKRGQAKVAEELAESTSQVSRLQLEVTAYQKREMDLRTQLAAAVQDGERHRTQLSALQVQLIEVQETSEQTKTRAKTEKDVRRQMEGRMTILEEEISDLKAEKTKLEKSLAERKRRSQKEQQRLEEEQEDLRRSCQEELESLRQMLKKSREQAAAEQRSSVRDVDQERLSELEEQAAQLPALREKCAKLQGQLTSLLEQYKKAQTKLEEPAPERDTTEEVKRIMNGVFQSLRKEFDVEEMYSGRAILGTIVSTIKATTLQLLNKQPAEETIASSSEEEEEEETAAPPISQPEPGKPRTTVTPSSLEDPQDPPEKLEEPAESVEQKPPDPQEVKQEVAEEDENLDTPGGCPTLVEKDFPAEVEVFQEVMDTSSALVHMISSDMAESSSITLVDEEHGDGHPGDVPSSVEPAVLAQDSSREGGESSVTSVPTTIIERGDSEDTKPDAPPPLGSDEESPIPPTKDTSKAKEPSDSLDESDEDLFKVSSPRGQKSKQEEEEEEEVSLKGRPPPTPLFGDEDEDDDDELGWLG
ncbi:LOW QUALITY PROTEIN: FK506-binding protein 15 [Pelodytes ibericus]